MTDVQVAFVIGVCVGSALVSTLFIWASRRVRQSHERPDTQGYRSEAGIW